MIELRRARADEAEILTEIQQDASVGAFAHIFPPDRYPFPVEAVRQGWEEALADRAVEVLIAEEGAEPVALAAFGPELLRSLHVRPRAQGTGIGSRLHDVAIERRRAAGDSLCRLWTLAENHAARKFYERRGWQLDGRTRTVAFPPHPLDVGYSLDLTIPTC